MNIDDLTIGQLKQINAMTGGTASAPQHPCVGKRVLVVLPGRFIYMGTLEQEGEHCVLKDAQNVRYWKDRGNGLGGLAAKGPIPGDKIDDCPPVWFRSSEEIVIMEATHE